MDADKTLAAVDTGDLFWKMALKRNPNPSKRVFEAFLYYSYTTFCQANLLYKVIADDQEFDILCQNVASEVKMHRVFVSILR